ncbi:hypothetical protein [Poseidonibacter ostreae]|nr:hypothetical protein [Poseidonibacter ostreae]
MKSKNFNSRTYNKRFFFLEIISFLVMLIKFPIFIFKKNTQVFVEHARYQKVDDTFVEPYSFLSQKKVLDNSRSLIRIGTIKNGINDMNILNFNYLFISQYQFQFFSLFLGIFLFPLSIVFFYQSYVQLSRHFTKQILGKGYFLKLLYYSGSNLLSFIIFFILRPKTVNVTEAYNSNSCFILAANMLKIESYEFQHGLISKEHIGYNLTFKNNKAKKMFLPQNIYSWSKDWKEFIGIVNNENVKLIPWTYEYFYQFTKNFSVSNQKSIDMLIIGQPSISDELQKMALNLLSNSDLRIIYKAHPKEIISEYIRTKLTISNDNLYDLLLKSKFVVGGFSTALLEAKSLNCKVFSIINYVPKEYLEVLNHFSVTLINSNVNMQEYFNDNNVVSYISVKEPIKINFKELLP